MDFALVDEVGISYGPLETAARGARSLSPGLRYPVFAARAADGTTVVVDELAIEKSLHLRAWYRTLRLDPDGARSRIRRNGATTTRTASSQASRSRSCA